MKIDRHQARILAMQSLCQLDAQGDAFLDQVGSFLADAEVSSETTGYANALVTNAWTQRESIDAELAVTASGWTVDRLVPVDRNVLRVALVELGAGQVPPKVVINEAIEIAGEYGTGDSGGFVNGVLDAVWKRRSTEGKQ